MQHTKEDLKIYQALPLDEKIKLTQQRIKDWYKSWKQYEIENLNTGNIKYVTDIKEPDIKHNEIINKVINGQVYISFSGGKDSTVLLHIARQMYPDIEAVFCDTGLEFPEVKDFIKTFDNVTTVRPYQSFKQVIDTYGYPVISKETAKRLKYAQKYKDNNIEKYNLYVYGKMDETGKPIYRGNSIPKKWRYLIDAPFKISSDCCLVMKKRPFYRYEKKSGKVAMVGITAGESDLRRKAWEQHGCNAYELKHPQSQPLSFWTDNDIWDYIKKYDLPYCKIYDMGYRRTGCMFCMFGFQFDGVPNRFDLLSKTHPKIYDYCMKDKKNGGLGLKQVINFINKEVPPYQLMF